MKAFQVLDFGHSPSLTEVPTPDCGENEVLLRISACGLNFADLLMAKGTYQDTPAPPFTLGMEVCGTIVATGANVNDLEIGARVAVFGGSGGFAEFGVFPAERCVVVPKTMSDAEAAGFMVAYGTSHLALTRRARLQPGERLVVFGAAGGVGLTAVEIGKALGAEVVAVARGPEKCEVARAAGATHVIDSDAGDLADALKSIGRADVVYDPIGGEAFSAALKCAAREARLITIGFASGTVPQIPANILLVKNVDVIGFYWGGYLAFAPEVLRESLTELFAMAERGALSPHISHILPLERAGEALDLMRERRSTGKVVVQVSAADGHRPA